MPGESPLRMMRPSEQRRRKPFVAHRWPRHWPIFAPLGIVVVLAVVWVCLWYYAALIADRTLAGWVEREAAAGRVYSCSKQSISGFPLSIQARCADVAAEIKSTLPRYAVKAKAVTFTAEVYRPTRLIGDIVGPLTLAELSKSSGFVADWTHAQVSVSGVPPDPESLSIDFNGPRLDAAGGAAAAIFSAKQADLQGRIVAGSPRDRPVIQVTLRLAGATAPTSHPLLAEPIDVELDAVLRGLQNLSPKPWTDRLREMQAAGGTLEIKSVRVAQADIIVVGAGMLKLNEHGKFDGLVRVAIVGIEHLVPLLGVDRLLAQGIDRLSGTEGSAGQSMGALDRLVPGLSGAVRESAHASLVENLKKMGEPSAIGKQPAIVLPLRFADGAIYLGMLRVGELPPLF